MNKAYNFSEINDLKIKYEATLAKNRKDVEAFARQNNIPIQYKDSLGNKVLMVEIYKGKPLYLTTSTTQTANSTRTNWLFENQILNLNLQAENLTSYVWDSGHARITHQDFENENATSKISIGEGISNYLLDKHSTHVTGIIASTGNNQIRARGMAKKAQIIAYEFTDSEVEVINELGNGMLVSNHSYGLSSQQISDGGFSAIVGAYIDRSRRWDSITFVAPYYLPVTSAGNDGNFDFNDEPLDPSNPEFDKLSGMKTSKNPLVVANASPATISQSGELISVNINSSSSQGPTDDFRIKPDITGVGTQVFSTISGADDTYGYLTGTSMSSPNVAGTLLLLQELFEREQDTFMRASTLKALVLHTADNVGLAGPDAIHGWGLLNAKKAADEILNKKKDKSIIIEDVLVDSATYTLIVNANEVDDLEVSISWTDPAATVSTTANDATPLLVNDLNVKVTQSTTDYLPWKLTSVNSNTTGINEVDPFEKVEINNASGAYTIEISHAGTLTNGEQDFSLIVTGISPNTVTCSPVQNLMESSINSSSHDFSWDTSLNETNGYDWAVLEAGKHPDEHSSIQTGTVSTGTTSVSITSLSPATNYSFFVKTNCTSEESEWNSVDFSTACDTIKQLPFIENFSTTSASLSCWSVNAASTASWATTNAGSSFGSVLTSFTGTQNAVFIPDGTEELGFVSPYFDTSSFSEVQLEFYIVQQDNAGNQNETKVYIQEQASSTVEIAHLTANYSDWTKISLALNTTSTPFRIILEGISKNGPNIAIDDFKIIFDGYHFQDWVWKPQNPENEISALTDAIWVENKTAKLNKKTLAKSIQIDTGATLKIADILEVDDYINGNGLLQFVNNENELGQLASLSPTSTVTAETQVERWIPAGNQNTRAFRMISSPVTSTSSIFENWQENGNHPSNLGTHITGSSTGANGFDASTTGNPSLFWFDHAETNQSGGSAWNAIVNTDINTISAGKPYRLYVRGDRNINLSTNSPTPTNTILRTKGSLHTGDFNSTLATGDAQFSFIGNPYQAMVDVNLLDYTGDINTNYIYVWDPNLNSEGGFVSIEASTGNHATTSDANQFIQPGQGFFIRNNLDVTTTPIINFTEASKTVNALPTQVFSNEEPESVLNLKLFNSLEEIDAVGIYFNENYNNAFTDEDAGKLGNVDENFAVIGENQLWSINKRAALLENEEIALFINNYAENNYAFIPEISSFTEETQLFLKDDYTGEEIEIVDGNPILFEIESNNPESINPFRFSLVARNETLSNTVQDEAKIEIYPNPVSDWLHIKIPNTTHLQSIEILDVLGKIHLQKEFKSSEQLPVDLNELASGAYFIKINSNNQQWIKKLIKK
ncbi:S8 family serine peptidase [Psychroflexus salis]|uniref:Fibronectin type-III domain-containing protein n=1 Tax=Psychroflexus salis TaxID=1526574 RepID=A0A916ZZ29_9FLAO|nr:S8 family serine peptidase [Psychroflexus salis]GGE19664.1 hypothetical protein GCM10010831_20990 [Psychroflexus salis]